MNINLNARGFHAPSLSNYDFSTLYTTLLHNLIKEWSFQRDVKERRSLLLNIKTDRNWSCQICVNNRSEG